MVPNIIEVTQREFRKASNPEIVKAKQSYMKTTMPFYGIPSPERRAIQNNVLMEMDLTIDSPTSYETCIRALWALPHREEKYFAIDVALKYKTYIHFDSLGLYENMIREEYAWWDLVDPIAINLVGKVALHHPERMEEILRQWIHDDNMWIRRTAILAQLKHKRQMNQQRLFECCRERMHEKEFFVRKAIGWVLREYAKTAPEAVIGFLRREKPHLSKVSYQEASRILVKDGKMKA